MEWAYLATAPDQMVAETWAELLRAEGIRVTLDPGDVVSYLGVSPRPCRLLVPRLEISQGRAALRSSGLIPGE